MRTQFGTVLITDSQTIIVTTMMMQLSYVNVIIVAYLEDYKYNILLYFFSVNVVSSVVVAECSTGSVRLVNGADKYEGQAQVCVNGVWGTICDNGWDKSDSNAFCGELGFSSYGMSFCCNVILQTHYTIIILSRMIYIPQTFIVNFYAIM